MSISLVHIQHLHGWHDCHLRVVNRGGCRISRKGGQYSMRAQKNLTTPQNRLTTPPNSRDLVAFQLLFGSKMLHFDKVLNFWGEFAIFYAALT